MHLHRCSLLVSASEVTASIRLANSPLRPPSATKYLSNGACVASCPSKTYQDAKARTCKPCEDPLATTCTAEDALTW